MKPMKKMKGMKGTHQGHEAPGMHSEPSNEHLEQIVPGAIPGVRVTGLKDAPNEEMPLGEQDRTAAQKHPRHEHGKV